MFPRVSNWKTILGQTVAGGVGSLVALTIAGWPSNAAEAAWIALGGLIVGIGTAFVVEYVVNLHREVRRLQGIEQTSDAEREQHDRHKRLLEYRAALAQRESAINAAALKVWGDAYSESTKTGQLLPLAAVLARLEVTMKAQNIDKPLPPPELD